MPEFLNLDAARVDTLVNNYALPWGINILMALMIFIIGRWASKILVHLIRKALSKAGTDEILVSFIGSILKALLLLVVTIASLNQLGVDTTSLIALIGAAGLAIGLSLQDSLKNFASGVMLIVFRPFDRGHVIEAGGCKGVVEQINIFSTTMRTGDNLVMIVPNSAIHKGTITNFSKLPTRRVDMVFGIGYADDIGKARDIILQLLKEDPRVLDDPAPAVSVAELADSSVNLHVRPWVNTGDYFGVQTGITEKIKMEFDRQGISIPFPQMDLHVQSLPASA